MLKMLQLDGLRADLAAVEGLLASRSEEEDPVGWLQLSIRREEIEEEIRSAQAADVHASVGLFFGGRPVVGSRGIRADFAGQMVAQFQDLVSKRLATLESGPLAARGPVPLREKAQLMITDVARGSFGFVLEEEPSSDALTDTPLQIVVGEMSELIYRLSLPEDEIFESVSDTLDERLLLSVQRFFQLLDDAGATLRIVQGEKSLPMDAEAIHLARSRSEALQIAQRDDEEIEGVLYLLPATRRFELHGVGGGDEVVKGSVSPECLEALAGGVGVQAADVVGQRWRVQVRVREVQQRSRKPQINYTLTGLLAPTGSAAA
ncbi:hypothetical protein [Aromatoleum bremense]|uniref:Uncharacterized protein n=1 Tax=Aromatoleum bremense TaxID=76115 RepID=A0ABX1NX96_9RHOO|nr:hypothetical protein [Aromatoleum bremense]NMG16635.1 hypothetical protein [Aromatoleum bremense]QTQ33532.1 Uncharacterized protein pbN1_35460 [Aromatoleum bremense]